MSALDGKITIESGLRPCIVHIPEQRVLCRKESESFPHERVIAPAKDIKVLFHLWNMCTGNAIVEYSDETIHEVEPTQIRFVDNAMSEYVFPEENESRGKSEDKWKPLKRVNHVCPKCGKGTMKLDEGIVLTSNPPQYRLKCDKCGHIEYSGIKYNISDNYG